MTKKILIISYHSLPMDVIASYRAMAYLKHLPKFGFEPTLLTHHWGEGQKNPSDTIEDHESKGRIIRVPIKRHRSVRLFERVESIPVINKFAILARWVLGQLDATPSNQDSYLSLKEYSMNHLKTNEYDLMLGIFSPHHHLKLCYELHKKHSIPYILDFRDLWHNRIIHKQYQPNFTEIIQDRITKYHWKKWLSKAMFFSITSAEWRNKINDFSTTSGEIIHNGFDPEMFEDHSSVKNSTEFTIIHGGSLYEHQKLDIFLDGCLLFIQNQKPTNFQVKFIGADRHNGLPNQLCGYLYEPKKKILSKLRKEYCEVTPRIPKKALAKEIAKCQLLLFPGLPDTPGTHLGKIFDYFSCKRNILMTPDDNSVVGELIRKTKTGFICNTPDEVCEQLSKSYNEWKAKGCLAYKGNDQKINQYTRESQVRLLSLAIQKNLS
ncbi:MAG: hypothetical protein OCD76_25450 [Reichenbachiella sp.]